MPVSPPWNAALSNAQHTLILFALAATTLALIATLVRVRFASNEAHGIYRTASLTANAVVATAAISYIAITAAFLAGYTPHHGTWTPNPAAQLTWTIRYTDWLVTVPLLIVELVAVSSLTPRSAARTRAIGVTLALAMIITGFLGGVVIDDGTNFTAIATAGIISSVFFTGLYALVLRTLAKSAPLLPTPARPPYQAAVIVLLITWLAYPIVYGLQGVTSSSTAATTAQLVLCAADTIAKIGFGTLIHRTAVLRSRNEEHLSPTPRRPRAPQADAVWVDHPHTLEFDDTHDPNHPQQASTPHEQTTT